MTAIGKGDFVICDPPASRRIDQPNGIQVQGNWPTRGSIYRVRDVGEYRSNESRRREDGLRLEGIVASYPGHPDCWFPADSFRPISGGQRGMFNEFLKAPTDAPTREPVAA